MIGFHSTSWRLEFGRRTASIQRKLRTAEKGEAERARKREESDHGRYQKGNPDRTYVSKRGVKVQW